jgi:hypothetical protein
VGKFARHVGDEQPLPCDTQIRQRGAYLVERGNQLAGILQIEPFAEITRAILQQPEGGDSPEVSTCTV